MIIAALVLGSIGFLFAAGVRPLRWAGLILAGGGLVCGIVACFVVTPSEKTRAPQPSAPVLQSPGDPTVARQYDDAFRKAMDEAAHGTR